VACQTTVLQEAENGFSASFREGLDFAWKTNERLTEVVAHYEKLLARTSQNTQSGVSTLNAVDLF